MDICSNQLSRSRIALAVVACVAVLAACQNPPAATSSPTVQYMDVGGDTRLPWVQQGRGEPVVFVHGAVSDWRIWNRQRDALASSGFRAISYTQRYFGTGPWSTNGPPFSQQTHSDDLAAFIRGLGAGPVHLVGWSYAGHIVLNVALTHPEQVRTAFVFEPADPTYVEDAGVLKAIGEDAGSAFGPAAQALKNGDNAEAVRKLIDAVGERPGYFATQPPVIQAIQLDSAPSMPLLFSSPKPLQISCSQLGQLKPRVAIARGGSVRPFFRLIAEAGARCMPSQKYIVVPDQNHMWPGVDVQGFNSTLVAFLKGG